MNRHLRLAFIIAPLLLIGGFIAAEYYSKYSNSLKKYHQMVVDDSCDIFQQPCKLVGAGLMIELQDENGTTVLTSNHPLSSAAIAFANHNKEQPNNLLADENKQRWVINTARYASNRHPSENKLRLLVSVEDEFFFAEFGSH